MIEELRTKTWRYQPLPKQFGDSGPSQVHWVWQHRNRDVSSCRPYCQPLFPRGGTGNKEGGQLRIPIGRLYIPFSFHPSIALESPLEHLHVRHEINDCAGYNWKRVPFWEVFPKTGYLRQVLAGASVLWPSKVPSRCLNSQNLCYTLEIISCVSVAHRASRRGLVLASRKRILIVTCGLGSNPRSCPLSRNNAADRSVDHICHYLT